MQEYQAYSTAPFIQNILSIPGIVGQYSRNKVPFQPQMSRSGNLDLDVLQPQNQNPTTVTPFIAYLSAGLFYEELHVLGVKLKAQQTKPEIYSRKLHDLLIKANNSVDIIDFAQHERLQDQYWKAVQINELIYEVSFSFI